MKRVILFLIVCVFSLSFISSKKIKSPEGFVFIPSGSTEFEGKKYSCQAFWMLDHEVTNFEYRQFLKQLILDGRVDEYKKCLPDTAQWTLFGGFFEPMKTHYFSHPAYDSYPVVTISKESADMYCAYLTDVLRVGSKTPLNDCRIPTRYEWIYAAQAGNSNAIYPWTGVKLTDEVGDLRANYQFIGDENITRGADGPTLVADSLRIEASFSDNAYIIAPTKTYEPNDFGLYNMAGNVAEMVHEGLSCGGNWRSPGYDVRIASSEKFEAANPFVGFRPVITFVKNE